MAKISDEELETVVMKVYCELKQRKRNLRRREFQSKQNMLKNHVESNMVNLIGDITPLNDFI